MSSSGSDLTVLTKRTTNDGNGLEVGESLDEKANLGRRHEVPTRDLGISVRPYIPLYTVILCMIMDTSYRERKVGFPVSCRLMTMDGY